MLELDISYVSQKAVKMNATTDFFIDWAIKDYEAINFDFLDEDLMEILQIDKEEPVKEKKWKMYFDDASNALDRY